MVRRRRKQRGRGVGSILGTLVRLARPLVSKLVMRKVLSKGAKALSEGAVAAGAEYGIKKALGGKGRKTYKRGRPTVPVHHDRVVSRFPAPYTQAGAGYWK